MLTTRTRAQTTDKGSGAEAPPRLTGYKLLGLALLVVLLVQAAFVSSYVGALHSPKPRDLQVGVVGPSPLATAVARQVGFELVPYASEAAARDAIDHRTIEGAFIGAPGGSTLLVVPAAGPVMAATLANAFGAGAAVAHQKLTVVQVHPLPPGDAGGATSFLVVMALVVGGYLAATISLVFGGAATRHRRLLALADRLVGRLARHRSHRRPRHRCAPVLQVRRALGAVPARDDGGRVLDGGAADPVRRRPGR